MHGQIDGMIETMRTTDGAGLGANEVGETLRIAVAGVRHGNPSTLTTWARFERFHQDAFVEPARRLVDWVCS